MAEVKKNTADRVYENLFHMLVSGDYAPGDRIPSEHELKERFNVSRNTIRAALNRMNALGIIETRQGDGTYLKGVGTGMYINSFVPSILSNSDDLMGLLAMRRGVEVSSARLAAVNATEKELQEMQEYFDFLHDKDVNNQAFASMTSEFHHKIAIASKNPLLADMLEVISWIITAKMADFLVYRPNVADSSYYHYMVFRCIKQRKPDEAAFMMDCHMKLLIDTVGEYLKNGQNRQKENDAGCDTIRVTHIFEKSEDLQYDSNSHYNESDGADCV